MFSLTPSFLNLIEIFGSVQGETSYSGLPTTFVRLAACNLRCTWCDTTYSFGKGEKWAFDSIFSEIEKLGLSYVCVTGGEPLLQPNVLSLMEQLSDKGYQLSIETSGSLSIANIDSRVKIILDIKCPGSEMAHKNDWSNLSLLKSSDEIKFVLVDRSDYDYAKIICDQYQLFSKGYEILFSPVHNVLDNQELVTWIVKDRLPVRLNLQIHKFIWHPETKGV